MTDTLIRHDLVTVRTPRVTDGEEQLPLEGHLQHPAHMIPINTTIIPVEQACFHCCTCVPVAGPWVVLLQQWQDMLTLIVIIFVCLY